jgi:hypothetical protein
MNGIGTPTVIYITGDHAFPAGATHPSRRAPCRLSAVAGINAGDYGCAEFRTSAVAEHKPAAPRGTRRRRLESPPDRGLP